MAQKLAVGGEDFVALRKADSYYVDKTELLYELVETNNSVTLFTRPRRFGKTLILKMMECLFSVSMGSSRELFEGIAVRNHGEFCAEYMNQYPVVYISLKDVEGRTFEVAYGMLKTVIADVCKKMACLSDDERVNPYDQEIFQRLQGQTGTEEDIRNALKTITRMMNAVYGKPVILLIDEYDVPLQKAFVNGFYQQMLDVIRRNEYAKNLEGYNEVICYGISFFQKKAFVRKQAISEKERTDTYLEKV